MKNIIQKSLRPPVDLILEIPAALTFVLGVINIISAVGRPLPSRVVFLQSVFSTDILIFSRSFVLVVGLLLLILSYQLTQRSRTAWFFAVYLVTASFFTHLTKGFDFEEATFAFFVLIILIISRNQYQVRHRFQNFRSSLNNIAIVVSSVFVFGILGFFFLDKRYFGESFYLIDAVHNWGQIFFGFGGSDLKPHSYFAIIFIKIINFTGIFTVLYAFYSIFRPAYYYSQERPDELAMVNSLIQKYGKDSLDYFKKYHDKNFFIARNTEGFLSFKQVNRFVVVLSDPVALGSDEVEKVLGEFIDFCSENGWQPVFVQTEGKYLDIYKKYDFNKIMMGEEALLNLDAFSLDGPQGKEARYYLNRFKKQGFSFNHEEQISTGLFQKLRQVNSEWLSLPHYVERTFTEGYFEKSNLENEEIFTITDGGGEVVCFASVINYPESSTALLDLMRRKAEAPSGVMDFLIYSLEKYYKEKGYKHFDLSLAPLSGIPRESSIPEKTLKFVYNNIKQIYSFTGLRRFKEKFNPEWKPRYLVYRSNVALPFLMYAVMRATKIKNRK
jgi:phosphatidylglycerol lysyltransferase